MERATQGQKWLIGSCLIAALLIFALTLALSLTGDGNDPHVVLRGAAWILVEILVMVGLVTIIIVRMPKLVFADKASIDALDRSQETAERRWPAAIGRVASSGGSLFGVPAALARQDTQVIDRASFTRVAEKQAQTEAASREAAEDNVIRLPSPETIKAVERLAQRVIRNAEDNPEDNF